MSVDRWRRHWHGAGPVRGRLIVEPKVVTLIVTRIVIVIVIVESIIVLPCCHLAVAQMTMMGSVLRWPRRLSGGAWVTRFGHRVGW